MATIQLSVVAPDRTVVEQEVASVVAPGSEGYLGVQPGHMPLMTSLKTGLLEYRDTANISHSIFVGGGFMEVSGRQVIVLADQAEPAEDIDIKVAEEQLERARKALRGEDSSMTTDEAAKELEHAITRIKAARGR